MCDDLFTLTPMSSLPSKFLVGSDFFTLGNGSLQPRNQCMYWPEIFCLKAVVLSAHMYVLVFQDQNTLLKWNILSLLVYKQAVRQNISHTYEQKEQQLWHRIFLANTYIQRTVNLTTFSLLGDHGRSNTVFKLFTFVWSYEDMKVMDLGFGKLSITLIFDIFTTFS